jgi:hypothetical protein
MTNTATIHHLDLKPAPAACQPTTKDLLLFVAIVRRGIRRAIAAIDTHHQRVRHYRRQARLLR